MNTIRLPRVTLSPLFLLAAFAVFHPPTANAQTAPDLAALAEILGNAADWKLTPATPVVGGEAGKRSLSAPATLTLESSTTHPAPIDCQVTFRMNPPKASSTYIQITAGSAPLAMGTSVSCADASAYVSYSASTQGPDGTKPKTVVGYQYLSAISDVSLAWPEQFRRTIEAQMAAAPKMNEAVHTLRCTLEKDRLRMWVNGRYVGQVAVDASRDTTGPVRVVASGGTEILSVSLKPLPAQSRKFEPLSIAGSLSGTALPAGKLDRSMLTGAPVGGIPFDVIAKPSPRGTDHIDVSQAWIRFGSLAGFFPGNSGVFGGRWTVTDRLDPARICMYVPKGRYKALHLIAYADDTMKDAIPIVSAQFFRPDAGHPKNYTATVPAGGTSGKLHHVVIPLNPDDFSWFSDLERISLEITKEVQYYRGYPDPLEFSYHGGGLPSSVKIHAMTLERADVEVDLQPDIFGHTWTAPSEQPSYTLNIRNTTGAATNAKLVITTKSHDGKDTTRQEQTVAIPAGDAPVKVAITLKPTLYGLHHLNVESTIGSEVVNSKRDFAYLHPDTRERGNWEEGHGPIFGFWPWGGGHNTPDGLQELKTMYAAGAECSTANYSSYKGERAPVAAMAEKLKFVGELAFEAQNHYYTGFYHWYTGAPKFDPANPEASGQALVDALEKIKCEPSPVSKPTYVTFFAEPQVGPITMGTWPGHWGEDYKLTEVEEKQFADLKAKFVAGATAVRKKWPNIKILIPYGDPMNTAVFLKLAPETRELIDGCALDLPGFERMPEQQINQVVLNRLYPIMKDIKEYKPNPYLVLVEGVCIGSKDIDTGPMGQAEIGIRNYLTLMAYGVYRFESGNPPFECANYWGENHYGAGWNTRLPVCMATPAYVAWATMSRNLNRMNHSKFVPTGSLSTFCQQFKHYKNGKLAHVLWTIRGKRPVSLKVDPGTTLELYDLNDNVTKLTEQNGTITFTLDQQPQYLHGLTADAVVTLGESDHSDSKPAEHSAKIANLGDGSWKIVEKADTEYETNKPLQIMRFLAKMTGTVVEAPAAQGSKALSIHLEKQAKDRGIMPYYTTIEPAAPLTIPGKASNIGLWVKAASDWGRVVYTVRDAKGEKWISIGWKEEWNNDDIHAWSAFAFDGWRYVRFQMPSSLPYDSYREHGTSWWGSYGGDGIVDLPLKLEKIMIERRPKAVYGAELVETKPDNVLLGDLYAEYEKPTDNGDEIVRLTNIRMPAPKDVPELTNPIADLEKTGTNPATKVTKVADPTYQYDGTRCHVHFDAAPGATAYDVWVSPYNDGRGAVKLGSAWTESGKLVEGLYPDTQFYIFVTYVGADGKPSKPSAPLGFVLKNQFVYK